MLSKLFRKRKKAEDALQERADRLVAGVERMRGFRKKGDTFQYLGAEMLVVSCSEMFHGGPMIGSRMIPALVCEYMTQGGIKQKVFYEGDLDMLRRINGEDKNV